VRCGKILRSGQATVDNIAMRIACRIPKFADVLRILWFVPVAVDTVKNCTPDDGCVKHPKHVE